MCNMYPRFVLFVQIVQIAYCNHITVSYNMQCLCRLDTFCITEHSIIIVGTGEVTESFLQVISRCPLLCGKVAIIGDHLGLTPEELQTCKTNADDRTNQSELFLVLKMWMSKQEDAKGSMTTLQHVLDQCKDIESDKNSLTPANQ